MELPLTLEGQELDSVIYAEVIDSVDIDSLLLWHRFNVYSFVEPTHTYYWNGNKVRYSVTQYTDRFFEPFDSQGISKRYAPAEPTEA